jgi:serine/threonine-protein kinase
MCNDDAQYCPHCGFPIASVATNHDDHLIGKTLPGGYQILELVGVGGMGRVYKARQQALGRTVAVKVIHPHLLANENSLARFLTEARAMSQLNHPNSVSVIDFGKTTSDEPYLVMEFLQGSNLAQIQMLEGPLPLKRIVNVLKQVLIALAEAHAVQIIHRDLKPENIVLEPMRRGGDFVKVVDFGLAKLSAGPPGTSITSPGIVCGTPDYMAPEQGRGDDIDGRSDLYAVGVVLFWLLTGRLPFEGSSPTQVVLMHIKNPVPDPRELAPQRNFPDGLLKVLYRALAKNPADRFQDAIEFSDALEDTLRDLGSPVPSIPILPEDFRECTTCGSSVPRAKFCYDCGARLDDGVPKQQASDRKLPLMGREEDLSCMHRLWQNSRARRRVLRLVGEAGVGKTRLVDEFAIQVKGAGGRTVIVGPDPYWAEVAGYTLRALLRELVPEDQLSQVPDDPQLQYAIGELLGQAPQNNLNPQERRSAFARVVEWAIGIATRGQARPLVLAIDDLDRVDGLTRQALEDFLLDPSKLPVLVLGLHSPALRPDWPEDEVRVLSGLSAATATHLLHQGSEQAKGVTLVEVGNRGIPPLYVDEALVFGVDGGSVPPARLADLIALRLASLGPAERKLVQALAVLGETVPPRLLLAMLAVDELENGLVDGLVNTRVLRQSQDGALSLAHPLIQELCLHATPAEVRRELHDQAARVRETEGAPLEVLSHHAEFSGDSTSALFMFEQLANRAQARGDDRTASFILRRGLELAREELYKGQLDDPMRAIAIFGRNLGQTLNRLGRFSDAEGVLLEVLDGATSSEMARVEILESLAVASKRRNKTAAARRYLDRALVLARNVGDLAQVARLEMAIDTLDVEPTSRTVESLPGDAQQASGD